ncbi:hypothetical protein L3Q67_25905 [Saccharothrix sp. AJ9571]|nr:hypothetical protein L3Q67_25905 [Saccharothrix sp. AJ9571]
MNEFATTGTAVSPQHAADRCLADDTAPCLPAPPPQRWPRPFLGALGGTVAIMLGSVVVVVAIARSDTHSDNTQLSHWAHQRTAVHALTN